MHQPVLLNEVLEYLNLQKGDKVIDCTLGFGGHSLKMAEAIKPDGKILAIDQDKESLKKFKKQTESFDLAELIKPIEGNFGDLKSIAEANDFSEVNGILMDLGVSSWQIDKSGRGFSFRKDEPLLMTLNGDSNLTAKEIVNNWSEEELSRIIKEYGEERFHRRIAKRICWQREKAEIETTADLVEIIRRAIPGKYRHKHFATRTFQALRIVVNGELENLEKALPQASELLKPGGVLVVISFHSLEDRIVKNFFKQKAREEELNILTKKPLTPKQSETENNIRARSAKLRAASKK